MLMWSALLTLPAMLSPWAVSHDRGGGGNIEKPMSADTLAQVRAVGVLVGVLTGLKGDLSLLGMLQLELFHIPSREGLPENKACSERYVSPRPRRRLCMY